LKIELRCLEKRGSILRYEAQETGNRLRIEITQQGIKTERRWSGQKRGFSSSGIEPRNCREPRGRPGRPPNQMQRFKIKEMQRKVIPTQKYNDHQVAEIQPPPKTSCQNENFRTATPQNFPDKSL
jgi:hypothetical protein